MINDIAGKLIADKYRVETLIRESESGDLYTGRHEVLDKPVTLKILPTAVAVDQRWVKRFISEARAASTVSHNGILNLSDFGTDSKGVSYAIFEAAPVNTLDRLEISGEFLDEKRAIDIARQIAASVAVMVASTALLIPIAARIYSAVVLRTGRAVKLTEALKLSRQ